MADKRQITAGLYLVATPIGAARDITLRALDILDSADVLAAEDTRTLRHLMRIHGISPGERPVLAYHDHNGAAMLPRIMRHLAEGRSVAYASEAGTPLVADPGYRLVRAAAEEGHAVSVAPGPSAALAALTLSGLPTDRFLFAGFPPAAKGPRTAWLRELEEIPATLVIFESPKRAPRLLNEMAGIFGAGRPAALCRELTKRFEEVMRASLGDLAAEAGQRTLKGEIVLVVDRLRKSASVDDLNAALERALEKSSVKTAVGEVAGELGLPRQQVYKAALALIENR